MTWPLAFLLTLAIEIPIAVALLGRGWRADLPIVLLANALTHPTLWFVLYPRFDDYTTFLVVGEAMVFGFEGLLYTIITRSARGVLASVAANTASVLAGLLLSGC